MPDAFTTISATIALPKRRSPEAQAALADIVNEAKRSGIVRQAIEQAGLSSGARVAP